MTGPRQAIRLSELPAAEARAIFNDYVAGQPAHEDREVVLVRAPGLSASELESIVAATWKRRAPSHAEQA